MNINKIGYALLNSILLLFLCMQYAFYEFRFYVYVVYIFIFLIYFVIQKKTFTLFTLWNLTFICLCASSLNWTYNPSQTIIELKIMIELGIICNLLIAYLDSKEKIITTYKCFILAGIVFILRLAYDIPFNTWSSGRLGFSTEDYNPNKIGLYLTICALCSLYFTRAKEKMKILYYLLFIIFTIVIVLTGSRKAFLMLILGVGLLFYTSEKRKLSRKLLVIPLILITVLLGYYSVMNINFLYEIIGYRLESLVNIITGSGNLDYSTRERASMIEVGKLLFIDKPILGYGIGSYSLISGFYTYSHNNYIELLVGLGIIGLVIYYSIFIYIFIKLRKSHITKEVKLILIILCLLVIMDFGLVSYNGPLYQILIALGFAATKINNKSSFKHNIGGNK